MNRKIAVSMILLIMLVLPTGAMMGISPSRVHGSSSQSPDAAVYNGSSLSGWSGDMTINQSIGVPAPSMYATTGQYDYINAGTQVGKDLHFSVYLPNRYDIAVITLLANSQGQGTTLGISWENSEDTYSNGTPEIYHAPFQNSTSWSDAYSSNPMLYLFGESPIHDPSTYNIWFNYTIEINQAGTQALILVSYLNPSTHQEVTYNLGNQTIYSNDGTYLGIGEDSYDGSGNTITTYFDNVQIYSPQPLNYSEKNFTYSPNHSASASDVTIKYQNYFSINSADTLAWADTSFFVQTWNGTMNARNGGEIQFLPGFYESGGNAYESTGTVWVNLTYGNRIASWSHTFNSLIEESTLENVVIAPEWNITAPFSGDIALNFTVSSDTGNPWAGSGNSPFYLFSQDVTGTGQNSPNGATYEGGSSSINAIPFYWTYTWNPEYIFFTAPSEPFYIYWNAALNISVTYNYNTISGTSGHYAGASSADFIEFYQENASLEIPSYSITWQTGLYPSANITTSENPSDVGAPVEFTANVGNGSSPFTYSWNVQNSTYTGREINVTFGSIGKHSVNLTVTDAAGNKAYSTFYETINQGPSISASTNISAADTNYPIEFKSSPSGGTGGYIYSWVLNGNQVSTSQDFSYSFSSPGNYTLTVTVRDSIGETASSSVTVTIDPNPSAAIISSQNPTDIGNSVTFSASVTGGIGSMNYEWELGGSAVSFGSSFSYTFQAAGNDTVSLVVTDSEGHTATASFVEKVNSDPQVVIENSPSPADAGISVHFYSSISGGTSGYLYNWSVAGHYFSSSEINFTFSSAGTYTITLTVTDANANTATATSQEVVNSDPSVTISAQFNPVDAGENDTFTAITDGGTAPYNYTWYNGSSVIGYGQQLIYKWNSPGYYAITLEIRDSLNVSSSYSLTVNVISRPSTSIEGPNRVDKGVQNSWIGNSTNGSSPYTYEWLVNGVKSGSGLIFTYAFSVAGTYRIELVSNDSEGVLTEAYLNVTVAGSLSVSISAEHTTIDRGIADSFSSSVNGGTGPIRYQWLISKLGYAGFQNSLSYVFGNVGEYNISLIITDAQGEQQSASITVTVVHDPVISISAEYPVIEPYVNNSFNVSVSGGTNPISLEWFVNGTAVGSSDSLSYSFSSPGIYVVTAVLTDSFNLTSSRSFDLIVRPYPVASITPERIIVDSGYTDTFRASAIYGAGPYSFEWIVSGHIFYGPSLSYDFSAVGNQTLQLIVSDYFGKDSSTSISVDVLKDPSISLSYNGTPTVSIPANLSAIVKGGYGNYTVQWIFQSGVQESGAGTLYAFSIAGPRNVEIIVSDSTGFTVSRNFTVNVDLFVSASESAHNGLGPLNIQFMSSALGGSSYAYFWNFGNGNTSVSQNPTEIFTIGNYSVTLNITSSNGAHGSYSTLIESLPSPAILSYSPRENVTVITPVTFSAEPNWNAGNRSIANASWYFPNGVTLHGLTVNFTFPVYSEFNTVLVNFTYDHGKSINTEMQVRMAPAKPIAVISGVSSILSVNSLMVLNASGSYSPDANIISYLWTINGQSYSGENAMYYLNETGNYTASLTVMDSLGASSTSYSQFSVVKPEVSNQITVVTDSYTSGNLINLNITASSPDGIENLQVLYQGVSVPVTLDGYNNTTSHYSLVINQAAYTSGNHRIQIIAYNFNLQSNYTYFAFTVSSQYGKQGFNIVTALGGEQNFLIILFSAIGSVSTLISVLYGLRSRNTTVLDVDGEEFKATPGKPLVAVGKRKKERRAKS